MNSKSLFLSFLAALAVFAAACSKVDPETVPDDSKDVEQVDENPAVKAAVKSLSDAASSKAPMLSGIEVWQDGYNSSGAWLRNSTKDTRHQMWSVTKTFTGAAVGMVIGEGKLSLTDNVAAMFPDEVSLAEKSVTSSGEMMTDSEKANLEALTVKDLLTMSDGHGSDPTVEYAKKYSASLLLNWNKYIASDGVNVTSILDDQNTTIADLFFQHPFKYVPGSSFEYDSFASCLLSEIVKAKTGENTADYLNTRLFKPLGLDAPVWDDVQSVSAGGWGLHLTTGEMISFGRLLLQGGIQDGKQIIPSGFLAEALSRQAIVVKDSKKDYRTDSYGYQVWTRNDGSLYMAKGLFGQYIIVIPENKTVIALTTDFEISLSSVSSILLGQVSDGSEALDLVWKYVIPVL